MSYPGAFPLLLAMALSAQLPDFEAERSKANELFLAGKAFEALPLYEDLERLDPTHAVFAERRAAGLIAKSATVTDLAQRTAIMHQANDELLRAQSLGDNSPYVTVQLEHFKELFAFPNIIAAGPSGNTPRATELLQKGEASFAKNDYAEALKAYGEAAKEDPKSYEAALYAGDTAFRMHDYDGAAGWFAKAIAVDPDKETAYRYWGDSLLAANKPDDAREKFVDAIVAQPYTRTAWSGLQQWAQRTHTQLHSPAINRPKGPQAVAGHRQTLAEETANLQQVISAAKEQNIPPDKLDPNLQVLFSLDADHMIESWILLHGADRDIAQDYAGYRETHRDILRAFIEKYDIVSTTTPEK